ncbi:MAG: hypothetical protein EXR76_04030 [Myxococcales bacterium]|nr:hypothetical protein [Myxococcales bacterium]
MSHAYSLALVFSLTALTATLTACPAAALDNDPALRGFGTYVPGLGVTKDQGGFEAFSRELGMAMAPVLMAPAETLGVNGFYVGLLEYSATNIDESSSYWKKGTERTLAASQAHALNPEGNPDAEAPDFLHTLRFRMRKGLPYSLEMGAQVTYLVDSELWAFGGEVKWALNEGVDALPVDFAIRGAASRTLGSTELDLTTVGVDLILGRGFGVGGQVNLAPYMAYNPVWIYARSGVLDSTPGIDPELMGSGADGEATFVLDSADQTLHRFVFGARVSTAALNLTPEIVLAKGLQSYNVNLGLEF